MSDQENPTEQCLSPSPVSHASPIEQARPSTPRKPKSNGRRRATMACRSCRSRKVRCDVAEHGVPCCNCKLDNKECAVPERRRKRYEVNPICNPFSPIPSFSGDWVSALERPGANHLLQFIRNQHLKSQSQIDSQPQFSATRDTAHNEAWNLGLFPAHKPSIPRPEDPEFSRWLDMMPSHIIEKFRLYFQNADEDIRDVERRAWKPEPTILSGVQQAMDILQNVMTNFKPTHPGDELPSPPPDSMFEPRAGDVVDRSSEADDNLPLGAPGFNIATSCTSSEISSTDNDGNEWNEELMTELFYSYVGRSISGVADLDNV
ncbi:hypothetical protein V491_02660 [Pseudogymnoascus sp. VKM F-3775]|nr:hypothetical protein V491_02660 [Pseudogymnoascus sp. VKM F-3775]